MAALFTLLPEAVAIVRADSKETIIEQLATRFAEVYSLDRDTVVTSIRARETLGSTGFGRGVAIPHARMPGLTKPVSVFLRLEAPVDFEAADGIPVDLVFGMLSPEQAGVTHLHALAAISRLMRDDRMHAMLAEASDAEAVYGLLCNVIDRDAA